MKTNPLKLYIIIFLCCLLIASSGCHQGNKVFQQGSANAGNSCDTVSQSLARLINDTEEPGILSKQMQQLYLQSPSGCRRFIYKSIFEKLFFIAYANPDADQNIKAFLREQAESNSGDPKVKLDALFKSAAYDLYINRQPDSAYKLLERTYTHRSQFDDTLYKSYYTLIAQTMLQKGSLPEAANYYLEAVAACEKIKDSAGIIGNYGNLAIVYSEMGDEAKAIILKKKALAYFLQKKLDKSVFIGYVGVGISYDKMGQPDSALAYNYKALELAQRGAGNTTVEIDLYMNLAEIFVDKGDYTKAQFYFDKAKIPIKKTGSVLQEMTYTIFSTPAYAMVRDISPEIIKIKSYVDTFNKRNELVNVRDAFNSLYRIAQIRNQHKEALVYYMKYDSVRNILASNTNNKYIAELQTKYDTQKKEVKIQIQQKEIARKISFIKLLLALLLIGVLATAFIITRNRLKRKKKEAALQQQFTRQLLEKTEEERGRIARDLHDGLSQELLILKNEAKSGTEIAPGKIDHIINEVRTISRNIHPVMLEQIGFKQSILHICNQLMEKGQLFITANIDYQPVLTKGNELQLFRIIQEALNNIVKYAQAEAAKVSIFEEGAKLIAEIQDNGKGFNVEEALQGKSAFGLLSILERSKAINGKATISSTPGGTIIKIETPIKTW